MMLSGDTGSGLEPLGSAPLHDVPSEAANFSHIRGYEHTTEDEDMVPPPSPTSPPIEPWSEDYRQFGILPIFTEDEIRDALQREVKRHVTWPRSVIRKMQFQSVVPSVALHYKLETFTETRSTSYASEPFNNPAMDFGSFTSCPPGPWEVDCEPNRMYDDHKKQIEVPGTGSVTTCQSCCGQGSSHCFFCHGLGNERCTTCNGTGMRTGVPHPTQAFWPGNVTAPPRNRTCPHQTGMGVWNGGAGGYGTGPSQCYSPSCPMNQGYGSSYSGAFSAVPMGGGGFGGYGGFGGSSRANAYRFPPPGIPPSELCFFCKGRGSKPCNHCGGTGRKMCHLCAGSGKLRTFIRLTVKYKNEVADEFVFAQQNDVPEKLMRQVSGPSIFSEEKHLIAPLTNYPVPEVNQKSRRLVGDHRRSCLGRCRILSQRHNLNAIPVAAVLYDYKGSTRQFWVYGEERQVYIRDYPKKCCIL